MISTKDRRIMDANDLGILLGDWGQSNRRSDLNGDGIVDAVDLAILTGQWSGSSVAVARITNPGSCPICPPAGMQNSQAAQAAGSDGTTPADPDPTEVLAANLALMGFSSIDAFVAWALAASPEQIDAVMYQLTMLASSSGGNEGGGA